MLADEAKDDLDSLDNYNNDNEKGGGNIEDDSDDENNFENDYHGATGSAGFLPDINSSRSKHSDGKSTTQKS